MNDLNNRCLKLILVKTVVILRRQAFDVYFSVASVCRRWMQTVEEHSFSRRIKLTTKGEILLFTCIQTTTYNLFKLWAVFNQSTTSLLWTATLQMAAENYNFRCFYYILYCWWAITKLLNDWSNYSFIPNVYYESHERKTISWKLHKKTNNQATWKPDIFLFKLFLYSVECTCA